MEQLRPAGILAVSAPVRRALAERRSAANVRGPAELDLEAVRQVEIAFASRIPDDVLAVLAARLPALDSSLEMRIGLAIGHSGALHRAGGRADWLALGQAGGRWFHCVEKGAEREGGARFMIYDAQTRSSRALAVLDWLQEHAGSVPEPPAVVGDDFQPAVVPRQLESTKTGRRVRHAQFGEGRALTEVGTGPTRKLKVDFPKVGLKLLQARFLEFLDD